MPGPTLRLSDGYTNVSPHLRDDVKVLQRHLQRWGFRHVEDDGAFGPTTERAVIAFQRSQGLRDNGVVDQRTWRALEAQEGAAVGFTTAPAAPPPEPAGGGTARSVTVPWYSQYDARHVERAGDTACYRACRAMARAIGASIPASTSDRIQVATAENRVGAVTTNSDRTTAAIAYIEQELTAGRPVAVGVSHKDANYNADGITDHYVLVTGVGSDDQGVYYTYHDPATRNERTGTSQRFRVNATGNLVHSGTVASGYVYARHTEMSMVVRNAD